ncbi:MAG: phage integrase SAM-like domain-containing protein [Parachlamydiaceae bacterium]|nr:phage integrase SAM-like domain-containing protein [Parachlamydiaceae bacterium]
MISLKRLPIKKGRMSSLRNPKKIKIPGLYVYCNKCKLKVDQKCGLTGKKINSCTVNENHKYKVFVYIPGSDGKAKTKVLDTKDENEAIKQALAFREELEKCNYSNKINVTKTHVPRTIVEGMAYYISYLNNETPHEQEHKQRSKGHLNEVERYFKYFLDYLESQEIIITSITIEKLDKNVVGKLKSYLLNEKNYAPKTYNKYIGTMRVFIAFLIEEFDFRMKNPFKGFKRLRSEKKINTIDKAEFHDLLKIITPDNGIETLSTGEKKNHYKPWLKGALLLALLTGRRREELVKMKFKGIIEDANKEPISICIEDFKVNRSNDLSAKESIKVIYVPVISPLKNLLYTLEYYKYKETDKYILAPEEKMERRTIMDFISKSFTHYYKQLKTGKKLQFYDLRKTYISHLYAKHGEKARIITKHSSEDVMMNHYIDKKVIAEVAMDFDLFDL